MIVFVWTGRGFWTAATMVGIPGAVAAVMTLSGHEATFDSHAAILGVSLLGAAVVNWFVGRRWNAGRLKGRRARHTIFLLPMEYWSAPIALWGCYLIGRELLRA